MSVLFRCPPNQPENHENWKSCFNRLAPPLLLFARQWTNCHADAEDIVQEAFVRFWKREEHYSEANRGLLFAAVRSSALDFLRRDGRRLQRETRSVGNDPDFVEPCFTSIGGTAHDGLALALERLPPEQREVLTLKIWSELTFAEIASVLDIPANTAASRYRYALEALRKELATP